MNLDGEFSDKRRYELKRIFCIVLVFISGCTTVNDFKKMSSTERARQVCERQKNIQDLRSEKKSLVIAITNSQADLARGYKIHRQCQQVKVYGSATATCHTTGLQTSCSESRPESYETRCKETPVSINPDLERQNIQSWTQTQTAVDQRSKIAWNLCFTSVEKMTPEEAYKHY